MAEALVQTSQWVWTASLLSAGLVVLIVLLQRTLKERLIPGWSCLLWVLVLLRLLLPWSPESRFSILTGFPPVNSDDSGWQGTPLTALGVPADITSAPPALNHIWTFVWIAGGLACAVYTLWGSWRFARRMNRETLPVQDPGLLALFAECRAAMAVRHPVVLVSGSEETTPALYGLLKPRVVIPAALLSTLDSEKLRHIMLHELAHAKRHDIALNWLMHLVLSIHWFNPVLWYAAGRLRQDQEMASDALALNCLVPDQRLYYGHTLIHMLEHPPRPDRLAGNIHLTGSAKQLQRRIKMIKRHQTHSRLMSILAIAGIMLVSGCVLTNPKESGDPATVAQSASPSGSPVSSALASSAPASTQASPSPSPTMDAAAQSTSGTDTAAPASQTAQAAEQTSGAAVRPSPQTAAPSEANAQTAPAQLVPRAVPAEEQSPTVKPIAQPASPAEAGVQAPAAAPGSQPAPPASPVAEAPQIMQPVQAAAEEAPRLVPAS
jgi:bla regulator protein BlaR1